MLLLCLLRRAGIIGLCIKIEPESCFGKLIASIGRNIIVHVLSESLATTEELGQKLDMRRRLTEGT